MRIDEPFRLQSRFVSSMNYASSRAAKRLGITRFTLEFGIRSLGIEKYEFMSAH